MPVIEYYLPQSLTGFPLQSIFSLPSSPRGVHIRPQLVIRRMQQPKTGLIAEQAEPER